MHTETHTSPLNCSVFTALPYFLVALTLQASWAAPEGTLGALELSKHPKWRSGEVPRSFVSAVSARETSAAQCADLGARLLGSWYGCSAVPRSHAIPFLPLAPYCPGQARQPAPAAQLAALYQFNQPRSPTINQWWCTSVCAGWKVSTRSSTPPLNSLNKIVTYLPLHTHWVHTKKKNMLLCRRRELC